MTVDHTDHELDEAWLDMSLMRLGIKATVDQAEDFCERVAIKWSNGVSAAVARREALKEIFNV